MRADSFLTACVCRYRFISDEGDTYLDSRNTLSSVVGNSKKLPSGAVFDQKPFCLKYIFSASMCKPNSVKWEDASIVLFQKLGSYFLHAYTNPWDAQPCIKIQITAKTVVTEHFTNSEKLNTKVAILVIGSTVSAKETDFSINLGDAIIHLTWIQSFLQTPAAVTAASITKVLQKAFPTSMAVTIADFIVHGGTDSGFAYTIQIAMSDGFCGSVLKLEREVLELHDSLVKRFMLLELSFPPKGTAEDNPALRADVITKYFSKLLSIKRLCRSVELFKWVTSDDQLYSSSSTRKASMYDGRKGSVDLGLPKTELNTCVVKFSLHNPVEATLTEILSRYSIDTAHFCYTICVVVDGNSIAQTDLVYDIHSADIKPLFIPLNLLPEGRPVCLKFMVLWDKSRVEASSLQDWKLAEGVGAQCAGVFESDGNRLVEVRSKSRLTFMQNEVQDKIDHGFTFHLQANEAVADNQNDRALALNLIALSWWQRHKMMHAVLCKVLLETGSLYFMYQEVDLAIEFLEAGLAWSHRLKMSSHDQQGSVRAEVFENDAISDGLQELAMARLYQGNHVRSISCLLEALHLKQQYYLEEELDEVMLEDAANKISLLYTQLLFLINEALASGFWH